MREHGIALDKEFKEIFSALGKQYKYNLSENFEEAWLKLEEIVGVNLKQDLIGLIPTERNYGGIYDQPFKEDNADAFFADIEIKNSIKNPDGSLSVESIMNSLEDQFGNLKDVTAIDFGNGILNFKDGIPVSAGNQTLSPEVLKKLAASPENSVKVKVYYNPSHGIVGDLLECIQDLVGFYTGGAVASANAKKLAKAIERNPEILKNYTAHSQGTLILKNALNLIVKEGKEELLKGKKIHMNGSPGNMEVMKEFAEKYGIEFTYKVNKKEAVTPIGVNFSNSTNTGHTGAGNDPKIGYNKFQEVNPMTGKYEVNIGSKEQKDSKKVKYSYDDVNLIKNINSLIEKTGEK